MVLEERSDKLKAFGKKRGGELDTLTALFQLASGLSNFLEFRVKNVIIIGSRRKH